MINYHISTPKRMSFKLFYPRRRGLIIKILAFFTFIGFVSLWFKSDSVNSEFIDHDRSVKAKNPKPHADQGAYPHVPQAQVANPNDQIMNEIPHDIPGVIKSPLKPPNEVLIAQPNLLNPQRDADSRERETRLRAEQMFAEDERKVIPGFGEMGKAVKLSGEEEKLAEEVMKKEAFNLLLSDKISVNRSIPDSRDPMCKMVKYDSKLPSASVIIIFTNEAWSPLIRTIWSVINRTPKQYLKEIVLVDDFSDRPELGEKLDLYIKYRLPPIMKLVRLPKRHGLIRARLEGARKSIGDVLVFLDSHCECNEMWVEPLLHRIKESRNAVLVPIIDVVDDNTLEYYNGNGRYFQVGGFTWSGHFTWIEVSAEEERRRGSPVAPTRSPTMAGGLFAIDRKYFWEVGGYDEGMDVWGGENLEMSFRVWMCGGTLETIPCSRVGHIFRSFHPYTFPGNKDTHGLNTARLANTWMDDYKRLFFMYRPELATADSGDVTERQELRKRLKCHSFKWYLDNIYPDKFILDEQSVAYGRVRNLGSNLCLDTLEKEDLDNTQYNLGLYSCSHAPLRNEYLSMSKNGELRREDACADVSTFFSKPVETIRMVKCHGMKGNQEWQIAQTGHIIHKLTGKCLDRGDKQSMDDAFVADCTKSRTQQWWFDHYNFS